MQEEKEEFREVVVWGKKYQVSNLGNVISPFGTLLKPQTSKSGYKNIRFKVDGKRKYVFVHKLVVIAFLKPDYVGCGLVINHIDENKTNNNLNNLEVVSFRQNNVHSLNKSKTSCKLVGVNIIKYSKKNPYRAKCKFRGKDIYIGLFPTELEAHQAYINKVNELESKHGVECLKLNR